MSVYFNPSFTKNHPDQAMRYTTLFPSLKNYCEEEHHRLKQLLIYEKQLLEQGIKRIAGIDEVGRGCLAGPVVACIYLLDPNNLVAGVDDSKKLGKTKRRDIFYKLTERKEQFEVAIIEPSIIDDINIYQATLLAMRTTLQKLQTQPDITLIDGVDLKENNQITRKIIGGDAKSYTIGAASIIAKEIRDDIMREYATIYPAYSFDQNKGYGTKAHLLAIEKHGITCIHRKSFTPCNKFNLNQ